MNIDINKSPTKSVAALHDLSCYGRCALTVVMPVLAAMKIQTVPLPTALLSTHTGGFTDFSFTPLTDKMKEISEHWQSLGLGFDAIYTGFLGGTEQIETVKEFIRVFKKPETIVLIDPVMGDDGALYRTVDAGRVDEMKSLVAFADIITPNITELYFLLGRQPAKEPLSKEEICELLSELTGLGCERAVVTGVLLREYPEQIASVTYDRGSTYVHTNKRVNASYPGTGDVFASVLLGGLLSGYGLCRAAKIASDFTAEVIADTEKYSLPRRDGVLLEKNLGLLFEGFK